MGPSIFVVKNVIFSRLSNQYITIGERKKVIDRRVSTLIIDNDCNASRTSWQVGTDATNVFLGLGISVIVRATASDGRADVADGVAHLHTLELLAGNVGLNRGDVKANPSVVLLVSKVEFAICECIGTHVAHWGLLARRVCTHAALGVCVKGNVLGLAGAQGERDCGLAVVAVLPAGWAVLVPEDDLPGFAVLALDLHDVLVVGGVTAGDLDHVAAPWVTGVALVQVDGAGVGAVLLAEAFGGGFTVGGSGCPVTAAL